jgi:hypothetical protein
VNAPITFEDLLETMRELAEHNRPRLRSVFLHPLDYDQLEAAAKKVATYPDSGPPLGPGMIVFDGVVVISHPWVERGVPWYDPPEAVGRVFVPRATAAEPR